jgi:colanic acid/amylovoran biosynthesis glycosyltransferase
VKIKKKKRIITCFLTTFPVYSETFLQREIKTIKKTKFIKSKIYSLWGGRKKWKNYKINLFKKVSLISLFYWVPYWIFRKPEKFKVIIEKYLDKKIPNTTNFLENLLGISFVLINGKKFELDPPHHIHAFWSTAPTTVSWILNYLFKIRYSMGGHAYDIFEDGGDWVLTNKLKKAYVIHTSTYMGLRRIKELISDQKQIKKIKLIRRGLEKIPSFIKKKNISNIIKIISVGRLIEKKGFMKQLSIYKYFKENNLKFISKIVGGGPLKEKLLKLNKKYKLDDSVKFVGVKKFKEIKILYKWADFFFFTGITAKNGDRDGLPNVIPEAMSYGLIVFSFPGKGPMEAVKNNETGFILPENNPKIWLEKLIKVKVNKNLLKKVRNNSYFWIKKNFLSSKNSKKILGFFL